MTKRILTAFLGVVTALLAAVALPLGLLTAAHYRTDFLDATTGKAKAVSSVAEEHLADRDAPRKLVPGLRELLAPGETAVLLDRRGAQIHRVGPAVAVPGTLAARAAAGATGHTDAGDRLLVSVPIGAEKTIGVVVLARTVQPLRDRVRALWLTLAAVAVAALLAATVLGLWLSRWVSRPLRRLESVVGRVGAGNLAARAGTVTGPTEVRLLAASFDSMAARLDALIDGHRIVIADVSHQLRTPMLALRLRLELLQSHRDHPDLTAALGELNRLSRMVDGLLTVARAEANTHPPQETNIAPLVRERVSAWQPLATEKGVDLTIDVPPEMRVWVVVDHLEQILDNLLGNCFDLSPPPAHIQLCLTCRDHDAVISIADDGPGMSASQREHVFRRFVTHHADNGGTGLGLAIVHRLVTTAGGTIELRDTSGGGLTVEFTLPLVAQPQAPRPARSTH